MLELEEGMASFGTSVGLSVGMQRMGVGSNGDLFIYVCRCHSQLSAASGKNLLSRGRGGGVM